VDDHAMVRAGVRAELGDDVTVVGEAADVPAAVDGIRASTPDVVLLDVHLPGGGGRAVLETLRTEMPDVRWLALSVSDAAEDVIAVIRGGARGYVTKTISGPDLVDAVRRVADGDVVFSPRLAGFVLDAFSAGGAAAAPAREEEATDPGLDLLSAREREVMQLLARGYTYREIGSRLFISVKTVESHASNVLRKLQLSNRNELTRWAATNRLL
jgi:DNA-binding NarL/FixJ family response regulator